MDDNIILASIVIGPLLVSLLIAFAGVKKANLPGIELNKYKRERFERVRWIFNEQIPSADCPVMFLRGAVLKDKLTGKNMLQLKFINMGTQTVRSAYAAIHFFDDAGDVIAKDSTIQAEYLDINCASKDFFGQKQLLELGEIGASHIAVVYSKVVFADGTVWRAQADPQEAKPVTATLLKNILPPELQGELGEREICKPETLENGLWRCTCGCLVRTADGDSCPNCRQTLVQAQEAASIRSLERRKQQNIAKQKPLDKKLTKKQVRSQFVFAAIALYVGLAMLFISCIRHRDYASFLGLYRIEEYALLSFILAYGFDCISLIATALLVRTVGQNEKTNMLSGPAVKVQGITATAVILILGLFYGIICLRCGVIGLRDAMQRISQILYLFSDVQWAYLFEIFKGLFGIFRWLVSNVIEVMICLIPNFLYWIQTPFIQRLLKGHKRKKHNNTTNSQRH